MSWSRRALAALALAACAGAAPARGPAPALAPGNHDLSFTWQGRTRHYIVHVPPRPADHQLPVVVVFHGGGGNAKAMQQYARLDPLADREGFLTVYPDGTGRWDRRLLTFNAGSCCGYAEEHAVDDVGFVLALLDSLARRTPVDRTRVYATGLSNGAMMTYRLAAEAADRIAAIAPVAGGLVAPRFAPTRPVPVMHIHSVDDPRALYQGGLGPPFPLTTKRIEHPAVDSTLGRWIAFDHCPAEPRADSTVHGRAGTPSATHTATRYVYGPCADGVEVVLWKLTGAGHTWPGGSPQPWQSYVGPATDVIDANVEMWRFFSRFSLASR